MASILDLHRIQRLCFLGQCFHDQAAAVGQPDCPDLVSHWLGGHLHHRSGMCVAELSIWKIRVSDVHQRDRMAGWARLASGLAARWPGIDRI